MWIQLRELIALYETVRDEGKFVRFDSAQAGTLTKDEIKSYSTDRTADCYR